MRRRFALICLPALLLLCAACDGARDVARPSGGESVVDAAGYIGDVRLDGASVLYHPEPIPAAGSGPAIDVEAHDTVITGGSARLSVTSEGGMTGLALQVVGLPGWWEVLLPGKRETLVRPVLQISQQAPVGGFTLALSGLDGGELGRRVERQLTVLGVGTGELQVNVSFDLPADVDLHVVEPGGEEIYFGNREAESGGLLDLDSNRNCVLDRINNENITWAPGTVPAGTYIVRVNLWDSCGQNGADEVNNPDGEVVATVTVLIDGAQVADGTEVLSGPGNNGALGSGVEVLQFTF